MIEEDGRDPDPLGGASPAVFTRWGLLFYGAMAAVAVAWREGFCGEPILFATRQAELSGLRPAHDFGLGILAGLGLVWLSAVMTRRTAWGRRLSDELAALLGSLSVPNALLLALASGVAEELLFRGALQPRVGWVAASLLFGVVHFVPRREFLPWTAFAVAAGFLFGELFAATGNLIAPVVAHVVVNAVNLPLLIRRHEAGAAR